MSDPIHDVYVLAFAFHVSDHLALLRTACLRAGNAPVAAVRVGVRWNGSPRGGVAAGLGVLHVLRRLHAEAFGSDSLGFLPRTGIARVGVWVRRRVVVWRQECGRR